MSDIQKNTLDSVRLLIDATRKDLSHIQTLVLYGDHNGKSINTKMVEMEKDVEAILKALKDLDEKVDHATISDSDYKENTDKRIKALERVVWMLIGAGVIGGGIATVLSNVDNLIS